MLQEFSTIIEQVDSDLQIYFYFIFFYSLCDYLVHTKVDSIEAGGVKMSESVNGVKVMGVVYTNKPDSMTAT